MRNILFLLFIFLLAKPVISQVPDKKEMQAQMMEAVNEIRKQVVDLEKQIETAKTENPGEVKDLQQQLNILKKQLVMMQGLNKNISGMAEKTFKDAAQQESIIVPKKDSARINNLPERTLNAAELF